MFNDLDSMKQKLLRTFDKILKTLFELSFEKYLVIYYQLMFIVSVWY